MIVKWKFIATESLDNVYFWMLQSALALFPIAISAGVYAILTGVNISGSDMAESYLILTLYGSACCMFLVTLGRIIGAAIDKALDRLYEKRKAKRLAAQYQYTLNE